MDVTPSPGQARLAPLPCTAAWMIAGALGLAACRDDGGDGMSTGRMWTASGGPLNTVNCGVPRG